MSGCVHTYTVYTPIGDEGCPEGEPAVHACTVHYTEGKPAVHPTPIGDEGCPEGEPAVYTLVQCGDEGCLLCIYSVHSYW